MHLLCVYERLEVIQSFTFIEVCQDIMYMYTTACYSSCFVYAGILKGFDGLDLNHDQRLSSYEFTLYFPKTDAMVTSIFSSLDADGDYFVTYQEMVHAVGLLSEMAPTEEATNYYPERPNYEQSQEPEDELADYLKNHGDNANF